MSYPGKYDIKLFIGNRRRWRFYPKDSSGDAIDLSGVYAVFFAGPSKDSYILRASSLDVPTKCTISDDGTYIQMLVSISDSRLFTGNTKWELELRKEDDVEFQVTVGYGLILAKLWVNNDAA